jgi:hypothetical protein
MLQRRTSSGWQILKEKGKNVGFSLLFLSTFAEKEKVVQLLFSISLVQ